MIAWLPSRDMPLGTVITGKCLKYDTMTENDKRVDYMVLYGVEKNGVPADIEYIVRVGVVDGEILYTILKESIDLYLTEHPEAPYEAVINAVCFRHPMKLVKMHHVVHGYSGEPFDHTGFLFQPMTGQILSGKDWGVIDEQ